MTENIIIEVDPTVPELNKAYRVDTRSENYLELRDPSAPVEATDWLRVNRTPVNLAKAPITRAITQKASVKLTKRFPIAAPDGNTVMAPMYVEISMSVPQRIEVDDFNRQIEIAAATLKADWVRDLGRDHFLPIV